MRVLHVISGIDPASGGPTAALCGLAEAQTRAAMAVSVISTWSNEPGVLTALRLRSHGVTVQLVGPARGPLARHPELGAAVEQAVAAADLVHVHGLWEEIQYRATLAARRRRIPYILRPCGMLDPWSLRHHRLRKQLYMTWRLRAMIEGAAAIHFTTGPECERCAGLRLPTPIIIEPIGVNFGRTEVCPTPGAFRGNQPRLGERPYVLFLGRVCAKKGLDLLVPAFARCTRGPAMLVIAGPDSGGYRAHVERAVRRFGLEDNVLFTGMLSGQQRLAALAEAALFVLPSRQENFALAVAEAMGAGLPVIVSDQVNICADVDRAGAGAVVQLDVGAWAAELSRWLADGPLRTRAGARAAAFAREYYDIERIAAGWADHYDHLVKVSRPGWRGVSGDVRLR